MDFQLIDIMSALVASLKVFFLVAGITILGINYFHGKEAIKMERKLSVELPGSVHVAMSTQLVLSALLVLLALLVFFIP